MTIEMLRDVMLSDCVLRIGVVDVPDALAAALLYQGVARLTGSGICPDQVAAVVVPRKKVRRAHVAITAK